MTDWLTGVWVALNLSGSSLVLVLLVGLLTSAASLVSVGFLLAKLPAGYFCERSVADRSLGRRQGIHWWARRVAKNVLGGAIVILGAVMSLPGVPGPGLLVILVGITWTDFPAKRRLERWAVTRPGVLSAINEIRRRCGKPPMYFEEERGSEAGEGARSRAPQAACHASVCALAPQARKGNQRKMRCPTI